MSPTPSQEDYANTFNVHCEEAKGFSNGQSILFADSRVIDHFIEANAPAKRTQQDTMEIKEAIEYACHGFEAGLQMLVKKLTSVPKKHTKNARGKKNTAPLKVQKTKRKQAAQGFETNNDTESVPETSNAYGEDHPSKDEAATKMNGTTTSEGFETEKCPNQQSMLDQIIEPATKEVTCTKGSHVRHPQLMRKLR